MKLMHIGCAVSFLAAIGGAGISTMKFVSNPDNAVVIMDTEDAFAHQQAAVQDCEGKANAAYAEKQKQAMAIVSEGKSTFELLSAPTVKAVADIQPEPCKTVSVINIAGTALMLEYAQK